MASTLSRMQEEPPLPQDIVLEILLRAPPKTLIRCTCVCRAWYTLIKSPTFITSHSKHQLKDYDSNLLFVVEREKGLAYSLFSHNGATFTKLENKKFPFQDYPHYCSITYCNGLLCVNLPVFLTSIRHIFLWNPSIRRFKSIDTMCFDSTMLTFADYNYALGLDELRNEYKVVKIYGKPTKADVYSLSTNSWHTTLLGNKDIVANYLYSREHAYVNGAIHWLADFVEKEDNRSDFAILSFDFSEEVLGDLSLPTNWHDQIEENSDEDLKVLKGMLAFIVSCHSFFVEQSLCYVWLMKEYGVAESWTKAYTIVPGTSFYCPLGFTNTRKLVYYSYNGSKLMSYDLDSNKSTNVGFVKSVVTQVFFDFKESLILLDQGSASMEQALQDYQRTIQ